MKIYDFDTVINRCRTNSLKYDFSKRRNKPNNLIPMWVADMDFKTPDEVITALKKTAEHGVFGYSEPYDEYYKILTDRFLTSFCWKVSVSNIVNTPGIVFAIAAAIQAFSEPKDSIIIQPPVYYQFKNTIFANNRNLVTNPLILNQDNTYSIDFNDFEEKIKKHNVKIFILCNPHNPVGRVFSKDELTQLGDICLKHNVTIVSDEIHCDFVYSGFKHLVFASLKPEFADITVTCTSPGKTYNMPGLQFSDIIIQNDEKKLRFLNTVDSFGYSQLNTFGIVAAHAAYKHGENWLSQLLEYIQSNANFIDTYIRDNINLISFIKPESTYLAWLDMRALNLTQEKLDALMLKSGLWLDSGTYFGIEGTGFQRLNFGCPRVTLETALSKLKFGLSTL